MRLTMRPVIVLTLLTLGACGKNYQADKSPMAKEKHMQESDKPHGEVPKLARTWSIWEGNRRVLTVVDRPGPLVSTAPPPPGPSKLATHPFLSASAESPMHEHQLRGVLSKSDSLDSFLDALRSAGFEVKEETPTL